MVLLFGEKCLGGVRVRVSGMSGVCFVASLTHHVPAQDGGEYIDSE